jgi:hypothetical protein
LNEIEWVRARGHQGLAVPLHRRRYWLAGLHFNLSLPHSVRKFHKHGMN